jgi:hypothetical protein
MDITGTITRLVEGKAKDGSDDRVFIRPADPGVFRKLDGSQYLASGEVATVGKLAGLKVGDSYSLSVVVEGETA